VSFTPAVETVRASPCLLLAHLGRVAKRRFADALEPTGLTGPQAFALMQLRDRGAISQQELAETMDLDPSKLVTLLNELESDGLAERRRDPCDRRRHIVEISARGRERFADAERAMAAFENQFFSTLAPDERRQLQGLLGRVAHCVARDEIDFSVAETPCEDHAPGAEETAPERASR
jgi:DNA-binding MarR family transcriptional regulator